MAALSNKEFEFVSALLRNKDKLTESLGLLGIEKDEKEVDLIIENGDLKGKNEILTNENETLKNDDKTPEITEPEKEKVKPEVNDDESDEVKKLKSDLQAKDKKIKELEDSKEPLTDPGDPVKKQEQTDF